MFKIGYDKKITMVQGDTGVIRMKISNYELSQGDEVRFAIVNKANPSILLCQHSDKKIVLEKQVTVFEKDGSARIKISPYDTEYLQPGKYLYEIQVKTKDGRIDTVVPLTSFTLMDGSIQGEFGQTTPSRPEPTPSEIELRFKRLENEIIPELGNRITNVENEIDSVNSSLDNKANKTFVNVKDFGAKGDGLTDDSDSIQNAINSINKGVVLIPKGTYLVDKTILIPSNITLEGEGKLCSVIKPTQSFKNDMINGVLGNHISWNIIANSNFNVYIKDNFQSNYNITIKNLGFLFDETRSPQSLDKANVIALYNSRNIKVEGCYSKNFSQHFVDITGCSNVEVYDNICVSHLWSSIQVDGGSGGIYQGNSSNTQPSEKVFIHKNYISNSGASTGAIQIHKNGGVNIRITENTIYNSKAGITTDVYYSDNWDLGYINDIQIDSNIIQSSVSDSAGIKFGMNGYGIEISKNFVNVNGTALIVQGAKPNYYTHNVKIIENTLIGSNSIIEGLRFSSIDNNFFTSNKEKVNLVCKSTTITNNTFEKNGVILGDVTRIDPRDNTSFNFTFDSLFFSGNKFFNSLGDGYSFEIIAPDFREVSLINNIYYDKNKKYNISQFAINSGLIVQDYNTFRNRTIISSRRPNDAIIGQYHYDESIKKPIWFDGLDWKDATGELV